MILGITNNNTCSIVDKINTAKNISINAPKLKPLSADTVSFKGVTKRNNFTNLSKSVNINPKDKEFRYISLAEGMEYKDDKLTTSRKDIPSIAVIDMFSNAVDKKIGCGKKVSHGDLVTKYVSKNMDGKFGILAYDVSSNNPSQDGVKSIKNALNDLIEYQNNYRNIKAVNLSVGKTIGFSTISEEMNTNITISNIKDKKDMVLEHIKTSKNKNYNGYYEIITLINKLVDLGVQVYTSSGNIGKYGFDLLSLSKAQHIVGARDYHLSSNVFVNEYSNGVYEFKPKLDNGKITGITDGNIIFKEDEIGEIQESNGLFGKLFGSNSETIKGSSFASPTKLNSDLSQ